MIGSMDHDIVSRRMQNGEEVLLILSLTRKMLVLVALSYYPHTIHVVDDLNEEFDGQGLVRYKAF